MGLDHNVQMSCSGVGGTKTTPSPQTLPPDGLGFRVYFRV